ncbi:hypothetical protein SDC9_144858 [bioreactor metagenome]|uniref:Uncharacterized protein n=1 Tax=bioreactor metagenome TaxID=1076179 RepID=A0A645E8D2_9ZZZZ
MRAQIGDRAAEAAGELPGRHPESAVAAGADQIADRLGLRQVELAVDEGAQGEFAGLGAPRPAGQHRRHGPAHRHHAAVAMEFDDILAGVARRSRHVDRQRGFAGIADAPKAHPAGPGGGKGAFAVPDGVGNGQRLPTGDADNADGAAGAGGDGRNGIDCIHLKNASAMDGVRVVRGNIPQNSGLANHLYLAMAEKPVILPPCL